MPGTIVENGVSFDGDGDYFSVPPEENPIRGARAVTIIALFTATAEPQGVADDSPSLSHGSIVGQSSGSSTIWSLGYNTAGDAQAIFGTAVLPDQNINIKDGRPHTMMLTWQPRGGRGDGFARLYVDGLLVGATESAILAPALNDAAGFAIGTGVGSTNDCCALETADRYFRGVLGELRLYNAVQDAAILHADVVGGAAITDAPTLLGAGTATLNGFGYPNDTASDAYFRYGTDPALETGTTTTSPQTIGPGEAPVPVAHTLNDLSPDTDYYFRLEVRNAGGVFVGRTQSFFLGARIAVEQPAGEGLTDGDSTIAFISDAASASPPKTFTIRNTSAFPLTEVSISLEGAGASDFTVGSLGATTVEPGANTSFTVTFAPASNENSSATIHIASNVTGPENPFDLKLVGTVATVWTGPSTTFVNPCGDCEADVLTANVSLTRSEKGGLFNAATESRASGKDGLSPADTEWAFGTTANLSDLVFQPWFPWLEFKSPARALNQDAVLHLISDDIYLDIRFASWQDGGGGGFSYIRSTPGPLDSDE